MAGYREHVSISGLLGAVYGGGATFALGFTPVQGALAAVFTWVSGMLPDLDSQSGKPVREIFSLAAAAAPLCAMNRLLRWAGNAEGAMLLAILMYVAIRYGGAILLGRLSVHRGMFHSIPAMLIAAELAFLAYESDTPMVKFLMAGGVAAG
ncbi:MAG: metal-dependent hydrolase, partial [Planctomycetaceae bacterium]